MTNNYTIEEIVKELNRVHGISISQKSITVDLSQQIGIKRHGKLDFLAKNGYKVIYVNTNTQSNDDEFERKTKKHYKASKNRKGQINTDEKPIQKIKLSKPKFNR